MDKLSDLYNKTFNYHDLSKEEKEKLKKELEEEDKRDFEKSPICRLYREYIPPIIDRKNKEGKKCDIVVLGDIHGDYNFLIQLLLISGVVDERLNWIGGDTFVVSIGDKIDELQMENKKFVSDEIDYDVKQGNDLKIFSLFSDLHRQASKVGGMVITLLGNHELSNLCEDFRYSSKSEIKEMTEENMDKFTKYVTEGIPKSGGNLTKMLKMTSHNYIQNFINQIGGSKSEIEDVHTYNKFKFLGKKYDVFSTNDGRITMLENSGELRNFIGCTHLPLVIIGKYLFVHADVSSLLTSNTNIKNQYDFYILSKLIRKWILDEEDLSDNIKRQMNDEMGYFGEYSKIFFDRENSSKLLPGQINDDVIYPDLVGCKKINNSVRFFDVSGIIVGHSVQFNAEYTEFFKSGVKEESYFKEESKKFQMNIEDIHFPLRKEFGMKTSDTTFLNLGITSACGNKIIRIDNGGYERYSYFRDTKKKIFNNRSPIFQFINTMKGREPQILLIRNIYGTDHFIIRRRNMEKYRRNQIKIINHTDEFLEKDIEEFELNNVTGLPDEH